MPVTLTRAPRPPASATAPACLALSAARWVRLEALITALDQPPAPLAAATTRALVQALLYRALTDGAWDALPAWAPPATLVAATYRRWQQLGLLAQLSAELRVCLSRDDASS